MNAKILAVDDERSMREFLEIFFRREGYGVVTAASAEEAMLACEGDDFDVVITDVQMPGGTGLDVLKAVKEASPETVVIMITAYASTETAIEAMKKGAYDYITKPFKMDELRLVIEKALEKKLLSEENQRLRIELQSQSRSRFLVGNSSPMVRVLELMTQVAGTRTNVLISGESGTGKELVARGIHQQSERRDHAFVAVNCGAIPESLLESELFGHVKGAFTGAVASKPGLFEAADGGTLFLDEVGELPPSLQVKLLRVIQERRLRRVGGTSDRVVDVRLVAATNRDLLEETRRGRFREDLYYRLNVIQIAIPPLRERMEDVPLLVQHFIKKHAAELQRPIEGISEAAMERMLAYSFPGNVRELENTVERAVALCEGEWIDVDALPPALLEPEHPGGPRLLPREGANLDQLVNDYERGLLREALRRSGGVKKRAAAMLGVSFRSFRYRLEKLGLDQPSGGS